MTAEDADAPPSDYVEVECDRDTPIGTAVVCAVCEATGRSVDELNVELSDYLDPDALERLFADRFDGTPRESGSVSFFMLDCEVSVAANRRVLVRPLPGRRVDGPGRDRP